MGTDIHGVFQRYLPSAGTWEDVASNYEQNRHYQLFAVLAGVRNGYGFAGVTTGEPVSPIAQPRGLPADFTCEDDEHPLASLEHTDPSRRSWREPHELTLWMGDHLHSWLTGEEMLAWAEVAPEVCKVGVLGKDEYAVWDGKSQPPRYCGWVYSQSIVIINDNAVERETNPNWTHIRVSWQSPLRDELAYFFDEVARLVAEHGQIRFVFGFDS